MTKPKVIVIVGQTATGKSALAVRLAKALGGEIISADSRQVYKGLDIGTGKVTKKEMQGVPHHLLDVVSPKRSTKAGGKFTVAEFQSLAMTAATAIVRQGKIPIIVGGTGFYIDAVVRGEVYPEVEPNKKLRQALSKKSTASLSTILKKLDPVRAKNIDAKNPVRLIRAIEIAKALGKVPKIKKQKLPYEFIKIGLVLPPEILEKNIKKRVSGMFDAGLLDEIKKLKAKGVSKKRLAEFGFEYDDPNIEKVILGTLQYAKRQNTWFKRDKEIKWFTPSKAKGFNPEELEEIKSFIQKSL